MIKFLMAAGLGILCFLGSVHATKPSIDVMFEEWKKEYLYYSKDIDKFKAEITAEAWYWSKQIGLFEALSDEGWNTYKQLQSFEPYGIACGRVEAPKNIQLKLTLVKESLVLPTISSDISFALQNAAWTYFIFSVGVEEFEKLRAVYGD